MHCATTASSFGVRMPSPPVYGYLPIATTSATVISSGVMRSVKTMDIFFASSFSGSSHSLVFST